MVALSLGTSCTNNPYPDTDAGEKVFYTTFNEPPKTLDPAVAYTTSEHEITGNVFDTLVEYHYLKRPYELIPALAREVPRAEPLPDGKVRYLFELRPNLSFQDDACFELAGKGRRVRPIISSDFAFELMRIADPEVNSPVAEPFANIEGFAGFTERLLARRKSDPGFAKLAPHLQYRALGGVSGIQTPDESHLIITLAQPYPQILYWFAMPFASPLPWEAVAYYDGHAGRDQLADHPVGSGPYVLSTYDKQSRMVLTKNPNWYGTQHPEWQAPGATYPDSGEPNDAVRGVLPVKAVNKQLPFITRVEFRREKESIPAFNKFLQGYYDASSIIKESFDKVVREDRLSPEMASRGMQLDKSVTAGTYYLGFNMDDPLVGSKGGERSKRLRQAMSLAVDFKEYSRLFLNNRGVAAQTPIPPGLFGYEASYQNPYRQVDLPRAKALLNSAGYPGGLDPKTQAPLRITFDVSDTSPEGQLRFKFYATEWRKLGINVIVDATSYNKFQQKVRDGAYQLFTWGWIADYPDPENFLFLLWSEMARSKNNGPNTANFKNAEFDRLFMGMKTRDNDTTRLQLIRQMRTILEEERPWIELFHPESYALYQEWLTNVKTPGLSLQTSKYRDINPELRNARRNQWNQPVLWPAYALVLLLLALILPGVRTFLKERQ